MRSLKAVAEETEKLENKLIVHATTLQQAKAALDIGAEVLVHSVSDKIVDGEFLNLMKKQNAIYTPTLIVGDGYYHSMKTLLGTKMDIEDPNNVMDKKTRKLIDGADAYISLVDTVEVNSLMNTNLSYKTKEDSVNWGNLLKIYESDIIIAVGTDAGNPGTFHGISIYDELEKMQQAGIPASDLIVMATRNGAMAMERLDDIGTLEKGKMADLIILEKDPSEDISNMRSITHVMRGGLLRPVNKKFDQ